MQACNNMKLSQFVLLIKIGLKNKSVMTLNKMSMAHWIMYLYLAFIIAIIILNGLLQIENVDKKMNELVWYIYSYIFR